MEGPRLDKQLVTVRARCPPCRPAAALRLLPFICSLAVDALTPHLARHIIDNTLQSMDMEVVYSHGWEGDQGGGQLSAATDPTKYEEAYNTTVWDEMLQVYTAMFHWIGC